MSLHVRIQANDNDNNNIVIIKFHGPMLTQRIIHVCRV